MSSSAAATATTAAAIRRVSWIGTGVMGRSMLRNLVTRHPQLHPSLPRITDAVVYTRTRSKAQSLLDEFSSAAATTDTAATRLSWAASARDAARDSDVVFMMVGYPRDVRQVAFECLDVMKPGSVLVDFTTSEPSLAREIHTAAGERGVCSLDIPVSGGDVGAQTAQLTMFVGGAGRHSSAGAGGAAAAVNNDDGAGGAADGAAVDNNDTIAAVEPLLLCMGRTINYMGGAGMGQHAKMANQVKIASTMVGVVECMLYAHRAGLDVEQTVRALGQGAAQSFSLQTYGPRILRGDLQPGFFVEHFLKDLEIALQECARMRLVLPGLTQARMLYECLRAEGKERLGTQALVLALQKMSSVDMVPHSG